MGIDGYLVNRQASTKSFGPDAGWTYGLQVLTFRAL
jgi:hypothetical protein